MSTPVRPVWRARRHRAVWSERCLLPQLLQTASCDDQSLIACREDSSFSLWSGVVALVSHFVWREASRRASLRSSQTASINTLMEAHIVNTKAKGVSKGVDERSLWTWHCCQDRVPITRSRHKHGNPRREEECQPGQMSLLCKPSARMFGIVCAWHSRLQNLALLSLRQQHLLLQPVSWKRCVETSRRSARRTCQHADGWMDPRHG